MPVDDCLPQHTFGSWRHLGVNSHHLSRIPGTEFRLLGLIASAFICWDTLLVQEFECRLFAVVWFVWFGLVFVSWDRTHSVMHRLIWNSWPQMVFFSFPNCCSLAALRTNHSVKQTHVGSLLTGCKKRGARAGLPQKGKWYHFHITAQETGGWLLRAVNSRELYWNLFCESLFLSLGMWVSLPCCCFWPPRHIW